MYVGWIPTISIYSLVGGVVGGWLGYVVECFCVLGVFIVLVGYL